MKIISSFLAVLCAVSPVFSQKYTVEKSKVTFFSDAAIEDITASNKKASGIFNSETGDIVFSIPINEFQFEKSLMQEHFNEKYMQSDLFPKATYQGKVQLYNSEAQGPQEVKTLGKLTIHGVSHDVEIPGTIEKLKDKILIKSKFIVKLADYNIEIPQVLWQNIAEQVEVATDFTFKAQ